MTASSTICLSCSERFLAFTLITWRAAGACRCVGLRARLAPPRARIGRCWPSARAWLDGEPKSANALEGDPHAAFASDDRRECVVAVRPAQDDACSQIDVNRPDRLRR